MADLIYYKTIPIHRQGDYFYIPPTRVKGWDDKVSSGIYTKMEYAKAAIDQLPISDADMEVRKAKGCFNIICFHPSCKHLFAYNPKLVDGAYIICPSCNRRIVNDEFFRR